MPTASWTSSRDRGVSSDEKGVERGADLPDACQGDECRRDASGERLTEDLLERLLAASRPEDFLDAEGVGTRELVDYLWELLRASGLARADVVRDSGINFTVVCDIFAGKSRPRWNHAIMLAFGLRCDLRQTQRLLRLADVSELWCKQRRDAILIWCIENGLTRAEADDELFRLGEKTLLGTDRLG